MLSGLQLTGLSNEITVGDTVTVTCSYNMAMTSIEWLHNDMIILSTTNSQLNLTFSPVNASINNQEYTCRVNAVYGIQERNVTISVQGMRTAIL